MSVSLRSGVRDLQRLPNLNRFTLELNAAKNMHYIKKKKAQNKSCSELNFAQDSPRVCMSISHMSEARELQSLPFLCTFTLQLHYSSTQPRICVI